MSKRQLILTAISSTLQIPSNPNSTSRPHPPVSRHPVQAARRAHPRAARSRLATLVHRPLLEARRHPPPAARTMGTKDIPLIIRGPVRTSHIRVAISPHTIPVTSLTSTTHHHPNPLPGPINTVPLLLPLAPHTTTTLLATIQIPPLMRTITHEPEIIIRIPPLPSTRAHRLELGLEPEPEPDTLQALRTLHRIAEPLPPMPLQPLHRPHLQRIPQIRQALLHHHITHQVPQAPQPTHHHHHHHHRRRRRLRLLPRVHLPPRVRLVQRRQGLLWT